MKKLFLGALTFFLATAILVAQEDPEKALAKAARALGSYNLDPAANGDKMKEAIDNIEIAAAADATKGKLKTWQTRGEIYNALADQDINRMMLDKNYVPARPDAPLLAGESFVKALELAVKKFEIKDAVKGMQEAGTKLNIIGNYQIQQQDYVGAYKSLDMVLVLNEKVKANGEAPIVPDKDVVNHKYVVAYVAQASKNNARAKALFAELVKVDTIDGGVFAQYYNMLDAEGDPNAFAVLEQGLKKYPDNTEILFAYINYLIKNKEFEKLEVKLKEAIEKEPNNPSIYAALGNVYLEMHNAEFAKNHDSQLAADYFNKALSYFEQAVKLDEKHFDAIYSIGSLYFNKAVEYIKVANLLGMTKEDQ
ncbi:MAG: hypothetical protein AAB316_10380, partial [Bacteroidota bacterium]